MKTSLKEFLFTSVWMLMLSSTATAQSVEYNYDNAGNRISKTYVPVMTRSVVSKNHEYEDLSEDVILAYSNDVITIFLMNYDTTTVCDVLVCTIDGKVMRSIHINSPLTKIDMSSFGRGIYIVKLNINEKKQSWKIMKD